MRNVIAASYLMNIGEINHWNPVNGLFECASKVYRGSYCRCGEYFSTRVMQIIERMSP